MTDDDGIVLPIVGLAAAGAALYVIAKKGGDMPGPVTGSGSSIALYTITQEGAHGIYERIWAMVQGANPYDAASMAGFPSPTWEHMRFFDAWRLAEGGKAAWNPFNTTWRTGSVKTYNKAGVGQYQTMRDGEIANAKTIRLRYYRDLARRLADPNATAEQIAASPDLVIWRRGFKPDDGHPYVAGILKSYPMPKTQEEIEKLGKTGIPYRYPIYGV